jgi:hypothetical protein
MELDPKSRLGLVLNEKAITRDELNQFTSLKQVMNKNGVKMHDISKFVVTVVGAKQLGFDPRVIAEKVSDVEKLEIVRKALEVRTVFLEKRQELELVCSYLEREELVPNHRLSIYQDLESLRMSIKELKLLIHTGWEFGVENNISEDRTSQKFFSDVLEQYDDKLCFDVALQNLKSEIQKNLQIQVQLSAFTAMFTIRSDPKYVELHRICSTVKCRPVTKTINEE